MENNEIAWTCTDPSNDQYGRQLSKDVFEFKEPEFDYDYSGTAPKRCTTGDIIQMTIDLSEYDNDSMYHHVCAYYGYKDFEDFLLTEDGRWIIAECIFESLSGNY